MTELVDGAKAALELSRGWIAQHERTVTVLLTALITWALSSWYQRRSKSWELRSAIYLEANRAHYRLEFDPTVRQLTGKLRLTETRQTITSSNTDLRIHVATGDPHQSVTQALGEAVALANTIDVHFGKRTSVAYREALDGLRQSIDPDHTDQREAAIEAARDAWRRFLREAAREMGARPWWRRLHERWQKGGK